MTAFFACLAAFILTPYGLVKLILWDMDDAMKGEG